MAGLFEFIRIIPDADSSSAVLEWEVDNIFASGQFIVQRSEDGVTYKNISGALKGNLRYFKDTDYHIKDFQRKIYYRIVLYHDNKKYLSESIEPFYSLRPRDYAVARHIIRQERTRISRASGITIELRKRLYTGEICECVDKNSGLTKGQSECPICFGTGVIGGYAEPILIGVELLNTKNNRQDSASGFGIDEANNIAVRTVAFPRITAEDILVDRQRKKIFIASNVDYAHFKGIIPVSCRLVLTELPNNDIRYKLIS